MAMQGAKIANLGKMCNTCAFKLDSPANLEPHNIQAAHECLAGNDMQFNCHKAPGIDKKIKCKGFMYAKAYLKSIGQ